MTDSITINGNDYDPEVVSAGVSLFRESMSGHAEVIESHLFFDKYRTRSVPIDE